VKGKRGRQEKTWYKRNHRSSIHLGKRSGWRKKTMRWEGIEKKKERRQENFKKSQENITGLPARELVWRWRNWTGDNKLKERGEKRREGVLVILGWGRENRKKEEVAAHLKKVLLFFMLVLCLFYHIHLEALNTRSTGFIYRSN
jgi:hypothetical protein